MAHLEIADQATSKYFCACFFDGLPVGQQQRNSASAVLVGPNTAAEALCWSSWNNQASISDIATEMAKLPECTATRILATCGQIAALDLLGVSTTVRS
jgi:hypothetical protein